MTLEYKDLTKNSNSSTNRMSTNYLLSDINAKAAEIRPFSTINNVTLSVIAYASGSATTQTYFTSGVSTSNLGQIISKTDLSTSSKSYSGSLSAYCYNEIDNAGQIYNNSGADTITVLTATSSVLIKRSFEVSSFIVNWDYTPSILVETSVQGEGLVSKTGCEISSRDGNNYCIYGNTITLFAEPKSGYKFVGWSDGDTSTLKTITPTSDISVTAIFEPDDTVIPILINKSRLKKILVDKNKVIGIKVNKSVIL